MGEALVADARRRRKRAAKRLRAARAKLARAEDMCIAGDLSPAALRRQTKALEAEIETAEVELEAARAFEPSPAAAEWAISLLSELDTVFSAADAHGRAALARSLYPEGFVT